MPNLACFFHSLSHTSLDLGVKANFVPKSQQLALDFTRKLALNSILYFLTLAPAGRLVYVTARRRYRFIDMYCKKKWMIQLLQCHLKCPRIHSLAFSFAISFSIKHKTLFQDYLKWIIAQKYWWEITCLVEFHQQLPKYFVKFEVDKVVEQTKR